MEAGAGRFAGRPDVQKQFARSPRWRIRHGLFYPDGARVIRSKMTGRKTDTTLVRGEASRLERLTPYGYGKPTGSWPLPRGRRIFIKGTNAKVSSNKWQRLEVGVTGPRIRCSLNGQPLVEVTDNTFKARKIALWTKADSVTCLDDVTVIAR